MQKFELWQFKLLRTHTLNCKKFSLLWQLLLNFVSYTKLLGLGNFHFENNGCLTLRRCGKTKVKLSVVLRN